MKPPEWKRHNRAHVLHLAGGHIQVVVRRLPATRCFWLNVNAETISATFLTLEDAKEAGVQHVRTLLQQAAYELAQMRMAQPIQQPIHTAALVPKC